MNFNKEKLHSLADGLLVEEPESIALCIQFIESDTKGIWHGRARAMMCRRLKHIDLSQEDSDRVLHAILNRFATGNFSEQFRDMLRLAIALDAMATHALAKELSSDSRKYVRSQADWLIQNHSPKISSK